MEPSDFEKNIAKHIKGSKPAPVHLWNPPFCGDLEIHIDANGRWFYRKSEIKRDRLIKLILVQQIQHLKMLLFQSYLLLLLT